MTHPIGVLIADDHAVMRAGLRLLLESQRDVRVAGECGTHRDVLAALQDPRMTFDVVTLDITMPGGSAATLIRDVVRIRPGVHVVVLTMHDDPAYARVAIAA
jgi:DNA-binding NarL/FixJ family response regulator